MMKSVDSTIRYTEPALKRLAQRYAGIGLAVALVVHFSAVGAYWTLEYFNRSHEQVMDIPIGPIIFAPPPSITHQQPVAPVVVLGTKPDVGIPVPVPDASVSIDKTIPPQREMNGEHPGIPSPDKGNGIYTGPLTVPDSDVPPPEIFKPLERFPEVIRQVTPKYPELAVRIGIEGRVIVKLWVDKEGMPHQASVLKSDAEILNQSAIDAAMATRFTPGIMNKGPVAVWVVIPYAFKLNQVR
ncbi:MAG TPA: TonB family protein [Candidatus Acidoferrales bacterium]|nr:TonB family protein [Candidatus Acidoferrales bacterium]